MTRSIVYEGQNYLDVALQATGDIKRVFEIYDLNGIEDLTENLIPGTSLATPPPTIELKSLIVLFNGFERPKSGFIDEQLIEGKTGIGFMAIEFDFIVS
jgi:hypothetical protein